MSWSHLQAILQKIKSLEAQTLALQGAEDAQQQQQFAAMQAELAAAKAAALAVLHAAQEKRKKHEAEAHPDGKQVFDGSVVTIHRVQYIFHSELQPWGANELMGH